MAMSSCWIALNGHTDVQKESGGDDPCRFGVCGGRAWRDLDRSLDNALIDNTE